MQAWFNSSLGPVTAFWNGKAVTHLAFIPSGLLQDTQRDFPTSIYADIEACLEGDSDGIDVPVALHGTTFQETVWHAIRRIPRGQLLTYSGLAERVGNPRATRAVANACGANPCAVLIPCHRVIRRNQGLGGYAWGLDIKIRLLGREGWAVTDQGVVLSRGN